MASFCWDNRKQRICTPFQGCVSNRAPRYNISIVVLFQSSTTFFVPRRWCQLFSPAHPTNPPPRTPPFAHSQCYAHRPRRSDDDGKDFRINLSFVWAMHALMVRAGYPYVALLEDDMAPGRGWMGGGRTPALAGSCLLLLLAMPF